MNEIAKLFVAPYDSELFIAKQNAKEKEVQSQYDETIAI